MPCNRSPGGSAPGEGGGVPAPGDACSWGGLWGVCSRGVPALGRSAPGGCGDPPESRRLLLRTVCILMECILVESNVLVTMITKRE